MANKRLILPPGLWRRVQGMVFEEVDSQTQVEILESVDEICVSGPQFKCKPDREPKPKKKVPAKKKTAKPKPAKKK